MGDIRFLCPECEAKLAIDADAADALVKCPVCAKTIRPWGARLLDIKFSCTACGRRLVIDVRAEGCSVNCPGCGSPQQVPRFTPPAVVKEDLSGPVASAYPSVSFTPVVLSEAEIAFLASASESGPEAPAKPAWPATVR